MQNKRVFKPGTQKVLSPRPGNFSVRWGRLVIQTAGLPETKEIRKQVVDLWRTGYSHKDAAHILRNFYEGHNDALPQKLA